MATDTYLLRHLAGHGTPPKDDGRPAVLLDNPSVKVIHFAFDANEGLAEHSAPFPLLLQVVEGSMLLTIGKDRIDAKPGTWLCIEARTVHSVFARTPASFVLTLLKAGV